VFSLANVRISISGLKNTTKRKEQEAEEEEEVAVDVSIATEALGGVY
jgi:hypothetical protein